MATEVKAGTGVIVLRDNKVLIGKRKGSHGEGLWCFPGGHIEGTDKSLKEAGEREVFEETGIVCNVFSPDKYRADLFTTFDILSDDGKKAYVTTYLVAEYLLGGRNIDAGTPNHHIAPREPDKCDGWWWRTLKDLAVLSEIEKQKTWIPLNQVIYYLRQLGVS